MKQPYLVLLIGLVILLVAIEIVLIYIAITTRNEDMSNCGKENKTTTSTLSTTFTTSTKSTASVNITTDLTTISTSSITPSKITTAETPTVTTTNSNTSPKSSNSPTVPTSPTKSPTSKETTIESSTSTPITLSSPSEETTETLPSYSTTSYATTMSTKEITPDPTLSTTSTTPGTKSTPTIPSTSVTSDASSTTPKKNTGCPFNYILRDEKERVCVLTNMTIHIELQHRTNFQEPISTLTVPMNAITTGNCTEKIANMTLSWAEAAKNQTGDKENKISFNYARNNIKFFLDSIFIDVHLNGEEIRGNATNLQLFSAAVKDGIFICEKNTTINAEKESSRMLLYVVISDISLIVFNKCFDRKEINCSDETNKSDETDLYYIKIIVIISTIFGSILLVLFALYIWRIKRKKHAKKSKKHVA